MAVVGLPVSIHVHVHMMFANVHTCALRQAVFLFNVVTCIYMYIIMYTCMYMYMCICGNEMYIVCAGKLTIYIYIMHVHYTV